MRATAILIGFSTLLLTSCAVEPHMPSDLEARKELNGLKGPETGSIEAALQTQAQQAENLGDYQRAAEIWRQIVDKYPDNQTYKVNLAEDLRRSGQNDAALHVIDVILNKDPNNAAALECKGLALMSTGEMNEAATAFNRAIKIEPHRWRTLNGIGILFAMKGKYDSAVQYFQAALDSSTDNPSVLNNAALTYAIDKQFGRAYEAFDRARHHTPPGSAAMKHLDLNLALVYAVDGKLDQAEQTAAPYLTRAELYNNMGFYSYLAKNDAMAKGYLNMALTQSPTYYERAWRNLGALNGDVSTNEAPAAQEQDTFQSPLAGQAPAASVASPPPNSPWSMQPDIAAMPPAPTPVRPLENGSGISTVPLEQSTQSLAPQAASMPAAAAPAPAAPVVAAAPSSGSMFAGKPTPLKGTVDFTGGQAAAPSTGAATAQVPLVSIPSTPPAAAPSTDSDAVVLTKPKDDSGN